MNRLSLGQGEIILLAEDDLPGLEILVRTHQVQQIRRRIAQPGEQQPEIDNQIHRQFHMG